MIKLKFMWMIAAGVVTPMNETNDGHELYTLCIKTDENKDFCFEHAYKEEIFEYIETGTFEYNELLLTENQ